MDVITLKQGERQELNQWVRGQSRDAAQARRARLILLLADGERYGLIRDKLDCDTNFIARWKSRFVGQGLAGLYSRHCGKAPSPGSERQEARILKWTTQRKPADGSTHWSSRKLSFRINDDGSAPNDNPFFALGGNLAKYYAYGVRNSFGLAFDPITGELWDTENGPDNYDEINLVLPGFNSGWEQIMGPDSRDPQGMNNLVQFPGSHYADPKFSWFNTVGPTALVFLNSARLGVEYENDLFVGDIKNGNLYRFRVNAARNGFDFISPGLADLVADSNAEFQESLLGTGFGGITDLKVGPDGLLYV